MHDFRRLDIWREAVELAAAVYLISEDFPRTERFGMTSQIRSAAISVSSNIAEGAGGGGDREMARFLRIAMGSLAELDSQFAVAVRIGLIESSRLPTEQIERLKAKTLRLHDRLAGVRP